MNFNEYLNNSMFQLNDIVPDKEPRFVFIADYPASEDFITGIPASGEFGRSTMRLLRQKSDQLISDKLNLGEFAKTQPETAVIYACRVPLENTGIGSQKDVFKEEWCCRDELKLSSEEAASIVEDLVGRLKELGKDAVCYVQEGPFYSVIISALSKAGNGWELIRSDSDAYLEKYARWTEYRGTRIHVTQTVENNVGILDTQSYMLAGRPASDFIAELFCKLHSYCVKKARVDGHLEYWMENEFYEILCEDMAKFEEISSESTILKTQNLDSLLTMKRYLCENLIRDVKNNLKNDKYPKMFDYFLSKGPRFNQDHIFAYESLINNDAPVAFSKLITESCGTNTQVNEISGAYADYNRDRVNEYDKNKLGKTINSKLIEVEKKYEVPIEFTEMNKSLYSFEELIRQIYGLLEERESVESCAFRNYVEKYYDEHIDGEDSKGDSNSFYSLIMRGLEEYVKANASDYKVYIDDIALEIGWKPGNLLFSTSRTAPKGYMEA